MSQIVGSGRLIRMLVLPRGLRLLDRDQLAHGARKDRQRLGVGLACSGAFRQVGEMLLMRIDLALGGAPELAHHRPPGDSRPLWLRLGGRLRRGAVLFSHASLPDGRHEKAAGWGRGGFVRADFVSVPDLYTISVTMSRQYSYNLETQCARITQACSFSIHL
ncbi:hypothetical protein AB4Z10_01710 [Bosea sp. RAF48]|uniref:hypothetical protein n=1 Tax=Bosea sp. RAF48 TaxID=3237480 RepID=UPI003F8DF6B5